jgi:hypothetical protein
MRGLSDQFCTFGRASFFPGKWPLELINCGEIGHHPTLNKNYFSKAQRLRHHPGLHATDMDFHHRQLLFAAATASSAAEISERLRLFRALQEVFGIEERLHLPAIR